MAGRAAGMSLLLLLSLLAGAQAEITIVQSRINFATQSVNNTTVEGVATMQIGGAASISYQYECTSSDTNNGNDLMWSRSVGSLLPGTEHIADGEIRILNLGIPTNSHLGVYICTDTTTGKSVELNITSANPAVCPVENIVTAFEIHQTELQVYVSGFPTPISSNIRWFRPNGAEILENDPNVQLLQSRKKLVLGNVQHADAGSYEVRVIIPLGSSLVPPLQATTIIDLDVQVVPRLLAQPVATVEVREREMFSLSCTASGNPAPSITWTRANGEQLNPHAVQLSPDISTGVSITNVTRTLVIASALYSDNGEYFCTVSNSLSPHPVDSSPALVTVIAFLSLEAKSDPSGTPIPFTNVLSQSEGSQFTVSCIGSGTLSWSSSTGAPIPGPESSESVHQAHDTTNNKQNLVFTNFSLSDAAEYTCQTDLRNANDMVISEKLFITTSDPAVFISPTVQYVLEGEELSISAGVFASSTPMVQWFHRRVLIDIAADPLVSQEMGSRVYTLIVSNITDQRLGEYTVEATLNGQSSTDTVNVTYPTPPMGSISQSELTVTQGEEVRVGCSGSGVGDIAIRWLFNNGELPHGVIQNRTDLQINYVTNLHAGSYQCVVSNLAGRVTRAVQIQVRYPPFSVIRYNQIESTSTQVLSVTFNDGTVAPIFICSSGGNPVPTIEWRITDSEGNVPNGIGTQNNGRELVWRRAMEWTDSLVQFKCVSDNGIGEPSVAKLDLTVQRAAIINSISPFQGVEVSENNVKVPAGHTGPVLTCFAFGWPIPSVQWQYQGNSLPDGVINTTSTMYTSGSISSELNFLTGFNASYSGEYQCMVTSSTGGSQTQTRVLSVSGDGVTTQPPVPCSVSSPSVHFQVRVLNTDCNSWPPNILDSVEAAFEEDIARIISMQCNCSVDNAIEIEQASCSTKLANGVVFRGTITTNTASDTEQIFCTLSAWQENSPTVNIANTLYQVDSACSLELDSFNSPECEIATGLDQTTFIIAIAVPTGAVVLIIVMIFLVCCVCCCCRKGKSGEWRPKGEGPYSRTDLRYGRHVAPTPDCNGELPVYATLNRNYGPHSTGNNIYFPHDDSPQHHLPLEQTGSLSRDHLLQTDPESLDGEIRYLHTETNIDNPSMSTGNVQNVGFSHFPYGSNPSSGTSSRVTSPPQRGPSGGPVSAVNPIPDYEPLDLPPSFGVNPAHPHNRALRTASLPGNGFVGERHSPTILSAVVEFPREDKSVSNHERFSTASLRNRGMMEPIKSSPGTSSSISKPSRWSEAALSEDRRDSNCSESLPPYSSRPSSRGLTPASSMLDNSAYGHIPETTPIEDSSTADPQWFLHSSDASLDSKSNRQETRAALHRPSDPIPPYAMIHNSAIPYVPTSIARQSDGQRSSPGTPRFKLSNQRESTPQPYSEPVRTSVTSPPELSEPRNTTPSMEMITV